MSNPPREGPRRCAIYTRKSTTMGLEKDFTSLDAQREACELFVRSQVHAGWKALEDRYDDGGFTGANLERPAFQKLMRDIESGSVDLVIVHKIDRLSRSLLDFARVMERLTKHGVGLVSITQNFSTTDAMGRLTLNMLMSFAEYEREMIAERTRDKIAAARRRGKWTGGLLPLGYRLEDGILAVRRSVERRADGSGGSVDIRTKLEEHRYAGPPASGSAMQRRVSPRIDGTEIGSL